MSIFNYIPTSPNKNKTNPLLKVKMDGRVIGSIETTEGGYRYRPKSSKTYGETFSTIQGVKRSLETEE